MPKYYIFIKMFIHDNVIKIAVLLKVIYRKFGFTGKVPTEIKSHEVFFFRLSNLALRGTEAMTPRLVGQTFIT